MAKKKILKKSKKADEEKAPVSTKRPKVAKKAKASTNKVAPKAPKAKSAMVTALTPSATKLLAQADAQENAIADAKDKFEKTLEKLKEALGASSFKHPTRGPMAIMFRSNWYWRRKPSGGPKGSGAAAAKKATKKVAKTEKPVKKKAVKKAA